MPYDAENYILHSLFPFDLAIVRVEIVASMYGTRAVWIARKRKLFTVPWYMS